MKWTAAAIAHTRSTIELDKCAPLLLDTTCAGAGAAAGGGVYWTPAVPLAGTTGMTLGYADACA